MFIEVCIRFSKILSLIQLTFTARFLQDALPVVLFPLHLFRKAWCKQIFPPFGLLYFSFIHISLCIFHYSSSSPASYSSWLVLFYRPFKVHACTIYIQSIGSLLVVSHNASLHPIRKAKTILLMLAQLSPDLDCRLLQSGTLHSLHLYSTSTS